MKVKLLDIVILDDGSKATVVDILKNGLAFTVEQETEDGESSLMDVEPERIRGIVPK